MGNTNSNTIEEGAIRHKPKGMTDIQTTVMGRETREVGGWGKVCVYLTLRARILSLYSKIREHTVSTHLYLMCSSAKRRFPALKVSKFFVYLAYFWKTWKRSLDLKKWMFLWDIFKTDSSFQQFFSCPSLPFFPQSPRVQGRKDMQTLS